MKHILLILTLLVSTIGFAQVDTSEYKFPGVSPSNVDDNNEYQLLFTVYDSIAPITNKFQEVYHVDSTNNAFYFNVVTDTIGYDTFEVRTAYYYKNIWSLHAIDFGGNIIGTLNHYTKEIEFEEGNANRKDYVIEWFPVKRRTIVAYFAQAVNDPNKKYLYIPAPYNFD